MTPTHLLWQAAGCPTDTTSAPGAPHDVVRRDVRCWWCAQPHAWGRPVSCVPDTFADRHLAALPESAWLCLPCGWTMCDRVRLPGEQGVAQIRARVAKGGRLIVSVRGAAPSRWLVREAGGRVELRRPGVNAAADEAAWLVEPADVVDYADLTPDATERFRNYHHLAHASRWWPCTNASRQAIRAWLLDPPATPWVAVISDGQKHAALDAQRLDAITTSALAVVYYRGSVVRYRPAALALVVDAVEAIVAAGANDDEVQSGRYAPRDLALLRALREHDSVVAEWRGGAGLDLALFLRRPRAALLEAL